MQDRTKLLKITKSDIFNSRVPKDKILIKLTKNEGITTYKNSSILVPLSNSDLKEGIVLAIPDNKTFINHNIEKEELVNIEKGDIVLLNFVSAFSSFVVENEKYLSISPSVIFAKCSKDKYYKDLNI